MGGGGVDPTLYILVSKEKVRKGKGVFLRGDFSWEVQCTLPKIIITFTVRKNHMGLEILRYRQTQLTTFHNRIHIINLHTMIYSIIILLLKTAYSTALQD